MPQDKSKQNRKQHNEIRKDEYCLIITATKILDVIKKGRREKVAP